MPPILQIPSPTGTFNVVIKNSAGTTVYSNTETNAEFDPMITTPDDYKVYIDYTGVEPVFCFTVSECECPTLENTPTVILIGVTYYIDFPFDFSGGFGCPFRIYIETDFTHGYVAINSLADLTPRDIPLGLYYKRITIGGYGHVIWRVELLDGTICASGENTGECEGPVLGTTRNPDGEVVNFLMTAANIGCTEYDLNLLVFRCGDTCNTFTVNYLQINSLTSGVPDSGTYSGTASCADAPSITFNPIPFSPNLNIVGRTGCNTVPPRYNITYTDCCGNTVTQIITGQT